MSEQCTDRPQLPGYASSLATTLTSLDRAIECRSRRLALQKREFAVLAADVQALNARQAQCVYLDVGGAHFHAGRETLQRHGPHYLSALTSGTFAAPEDAAGYVFVDRDPRWFALVLAYLRDWALHRPGDRAALRGWQRETVFYAVPELRRQAHLEEVLVAVTLRGRHLHGYDVGAGRWRRLRDPLCTAGGAHVYFSGRWNGRLVLLVAEPGRTEASLELLDTDAWAWQRVPLPGPFFCVGSSVQWGDRLVLLVLRNDGTRELQALDAALSWQAIALPFTERYPMKAEICCVQGRLLLLTSPPPRPPQRNGLWVYEGDGWRALPAPANVMGMFALCPLEDRVVAVGGPRLMRAPGERTTAEQFLWSEGRWEALPEPPRAQSTNRFEVLKWRGRVVVMGRVAGVGAYEAATGRWVAWPSPRSSVLQAVVHDDALYACGPGGRVWRYDPQGHGWRQTGHFREGVVVVDSLRLPAGVVRWGGASGDPMSAEGFD